MLVGRIVQFVALAAASLWDSTTDAATSTAVKFCGRQLGEIMSRVCHAYNSPSWDVPTVVEQPGATVRRRRQLGGIADECCIIGCTWEQLSEYCSISAYSESPLEQLEAHIIADRSAEQNRGARSGPKGSAFMTAVARAGAGARAGAAGATGAAAATTEPTAVGSAGYSGVAGTRREVGRARSRGYGRSRARARRCWCRRKRRSGRRRSSLMGNMGLIRNAARAAPVVGTVSPLITWGRTLNTDLPPAERDRYAYVVFK